MKNEAENEIIFERGFWLSKWFLFSPTKRKATIKITINKHKSKHNKVLINLDFLFYERDEKEIEYFDKEASSFRKAILLEEIVEKENVELAQKITTTNSIYLKGQLLGFWLYLKFFLFFLGSLIVISKFFQGLREKDYPQVLFCIIILVGAGYYYKKRFLKLILYSSPIILFDIYNLFFKGNFPKIEESIRMLIAIPMLYAMYKLFITFMLEDVEKLFDKEESEFSLISSQTITGVNESTIEISRYSYLYNLHFENGILVTDKKDHYYKKENIYWSDIEEVNLNEQQDIMSLEFYNGKVVELPAYIHGWFILLQNIPDKFKNFDKKLIQNQIDNFELCDVCGVYALTESGCHCCSSEKWVEEVHTDKQDFIEICQINFIREYSENNQFDLNPRIRNQLGLKIDENWKAIITLEEIIGNKKEN